MSSTLKVIHLEVGYTDDEIRDCILQADDELRGSGVTEPRDCFLVGVGGYNDDERELGQIPEVRGLLRRFIALGGLGVLACASFSEDRPELRPTAEGADHYLGAMEVWGTAQGYIGAGGPVVLPVEEFRPVYVRSCAALARLADAAIKADKGRELYWWVAINGPACAASSLPLPETVEVTPTPRLLVGFKTREEQQGAVRKLLRAPIAKVRRYTREVLPAKAERGEVRLIRPAKPEPPARGPTLWSVGSA